MKRHLRSATIDDGLAVAKIYGPIVEETAISFEFERPSGAEMSERIGAALERGDPWLVCEADGVVVGYSYAAPFRSRPAYTATKESTVYIAPSHHGQGVGSQLMVELLAQLKALRAHVVVAGITLPNAGSVALHERLGFIPSGVIPQAGLKFDRWHDLGFWHRLL